MSQTIQKSRRLEVRRKSKTLKNGIKRAVALSLVCTFSLQADWQDTITGLTNEAMSVWDEQTRTMLQKEADDENLTERNRRLHKEHFDAIWEDVIGGLEKGLAINREMEKAPDHAIFGEDKTSLRKDFNDVLDDIIDLLLDDNLFNYRETIRESKKKISQAEQDILRYREKKIVAPIESRIKTPKADYEKKIDEARETIAREKAAIIQTKTAMSQNFKELGINLTPEQIDVLLSRIDGDDIIKMTLVMDVLKQITSQLLGIMQESGEELVHAKKYYGMHMVLLELVVYIQDKLIDKIARHYLPKIDQIIDHTKEMLAKTNQKISSEENMQRRNIYYQNYQSQQLTLKTAILYRQNLLNELQQVREARAVSRKNLELSKNTYETVTLSSDLFKIIASSQEMMKEVMKLQIPTIIPFENSQMKEKYQELTKKLQGR
jgi:outer membrane protein OmpA-like peptidoglycan-associated protein